MRWFPIRINSIGQNLRPTNGLSVQTTYSWSKSMQLGGGSGPGIANPGTTGGSAYTDPLNRNLDRMRGVESLHSLLTNGTLALPIGPNKLLFGSSSGWVARVIEGWQSSFILNMATGQPVSVGGNGRIRVYDASAPGTPVDTIDLSTAHVVNTTSGSTVTSASTDDSIRPRE